METKDKLYYLCINEMDFLTSEQKLLLDRYLIKNRYYLYKSREEKQNLKLIFNRVNKGETKMVKKFYELEAGYRTSLKELEKKADLVITLLNKTSNNDLSYKWEIVKSFLTRDDMIDIINHNLTNDDGFYGCPSEYDELRNITNTTGYCDTSCVNCWKQIFNIKEIKFKGED